VTQALWWIAWLLGPFFLGFDSSELLFHPPRTIGAALGHLLSSVGIAFLLWAGAVSTTWFSLLWVGRPPAPFAGEEFVGKILVVILLGAVIRCLRRYANRSRWE
jgi:hypothetical protein